MKNIINTYRMKFSVIITFCILLFGCKKTQIEPAHPVLAKIDTAIQKNNAESQKIYSCEELLKEIVLSSNLEAVEKFSEVFIRIENISDDNITVEMYTKDVSDRSGQMRTVENTAAWLEFIPGSNKLLDITADPKSPVELHYDKNILSKYPFSEICGAKLVKYEPKKKGTQCRDITGDMMSGQECIIFSETLAGAYKEMISKALVKDSKYLPKELPAKSITVDINQNGLMVADVKVQDNKISIEMEYAGGITDIILEKNGDNIKRTITYSAD